MKLWIIVGLIALTIWALLTFVLAVATGWIHLLLGFGVVSLVIGWGETSPTTADS